MANAATVTARVTRPSQSSPSLSDTIGTIIRYHRHHHPIPSARGDAFCRARVGSGTQQYTCCVLGRCGRYGWVGRPQQYASCLPGSCGLHVLFLSCCSACCLPRQTETLHNANPNALSGHPCIKIGLPRFWVEAIPKTIPGMRKKRVGKIIRFGCIKVAPWFYGPKNVVFGFQISLFRDACLTRFFHTCRTAGNTSALLFLPRCKIQDLLHCF